MFPLMRYASRALVVAAAVAASAACSTARTTPRLPAAALERATPGDPGLPLSGHYIATIKAPLLGEVRGRITAAPYGDGMFATTRPGVAWDMIGGLKGLFGSMFVGSLFPDGAILTWTSGLPKDGRPGAGLLGPGDKNSQVRTRVTSATGPIELATRDGRPVATMTLRPAEPGEGPLADYRALADGVERAMAARLYDASLPRSGQVRGFVRMLRSNAGAARDDIEFIFGAVVAAREHITFAMPLVFKRVDPDWRNQLASLGDSGLATLSVSYDEPSGIAVLKAEAFLDAAEVDRAFEKVLSHNPRGVLLDLRGCPGVTLASLRLASWVVEEPVDAGTFFGPTMRTAAAKGRLGEFPRLAIDSAESVERLEKHLDEGGGARVIVEPEAGRYTGPVAVLTTKRTTTSTESLIWTLRAAAGGPPEPPWGGGDAAPPNQRIRVFGQPTAGRPTVSRPVDIGQGWVAWVPALDYLPPARFAGARTERGARPDFEDPSKERCKQEARKWLAEKAAATAQDNPATSAPSAARSASPPPS
ncbi:MAG: hypothetical protein WD749_05565 [Phycisphaerales bacterium]